MKVAISILGRFHLFNLAQQLLRRGYLSQLITSYPKFEAAKYGIPGDKVSSIISKEILTRIWVMLPNFAQHWYNPQYFFHQFFDKRSSRVLKRADILVAGPSVFAYTMQEAKKRGMLVVVENGSAHTLYQTKILGEEYAKFRIKPGTFQISEPRLIENDLRAYGEMDYIAVPSTFAKRTFLEQGIPEKKLICVAYGVDLSEFRPAVKTDSIFRVVFAGGMTLQKGVHYLLQAFAELRLPNAELLLIGSLSDEMKIFFKKYEGNFRYIGRVSQRELASYYTQSSVFVLNSLQDGFGMVIIQAMACGLPVIATTNTGGPDVIREGVDGFIIPVRDVPALKEKLLYLFEHPEICGEMGLSAEKRVRKGFSWDDYGERIIKEYMRILEERKR